MNKLCRHCRDRPAGRPRGLCSPCYSRPEVRSRYGVLTPACAACGRRLADSVATRRGDLCARCDGKGPSVLIAAKLRRVERLLARGVGAGPTGAEPGSVRKVAVLCVRADRGLPLWHARDVSRSGSAHVPLFE